MATLLGLTSTEPETLVRHQSRHPTADGPTHPAGLSGGSCSVAAQTPIYNTRGDKVNDSTAKFAYTETKEQELARRLVNGSPHLGQENVEVLANAVSASSSKIAAFNTFSKALETYWKAGPASEADVSAHPRA